MCMSNSGMWKMGCMVTQQRGLVVKRIVVFKETPEMERLNQASIVRSI